jgi:two-component system, LuxR family, sensor histidine kinase DctS
MRSASSIPREFTPVTQASVLKRYLWLLPMLLAIAIAALLALWAELNDRVEIAAFQKTLVADARSVEAQLSGRQEMERSKLSEVAAKLSHQHKYSDSTLQTLPGVIAGLDRLWNRITWVDENNQVIARATRASTAHSIGPEYLQIQSAGQAEHFVVPVTTTDGAQIGNLLARYDITELLQGTDLAWLNQRYQVDFLSELGEVIATTANPTQKPLGAIFDKTLVAFKDTTLRLTPYEAPSSWRSSTRTLGILGGLLLLGLAASQLLRREMARVARGLIALQTDAAWRQSMEDSAIVGMRARDLEGRILYVNKTLCDMVGYGPQELVGLAPPLPFWPAQSVNTLLRRNATTLAGEAPVDGYETRWNHKDGRPVDVMVFESPLLQADGSHIGWMGTIVDISERKVLEEKERTHVEAMAQHARLNDMGVIASELAHELNQPLTTISSYSAGLKVAIKKHLPEDTDLQQAADAIHRSAAKAGDIVNWIRRQSSRSQSQRSEADLNALALESLDHRRRQFEVAGILVHTNLVTLPPLVTVDSIGIEQVVTNLLRNAADALADVEAQRHVLLETNLKNDASGAITEVELSVSDNGPGLQGRTIDTLCSTFYSTKTHGMGLGLGICRAIIESHGGRLDAQDTPTGGARFSFRLPLITIDKNEH